MAERHTIVVLVEAGSVRGVRFCACVPPVTVEVRTYTQSKEAEGKARPAWFMPGGDAQASEFMRDADGVYSATFYESDDDPD